MKAPRRAAFAALTLGFALCLAACSDDGSEGADGADDSLPTYAPDADEAWEQTVAAAEDEGKVTWYTVAPQAAIDGLVSAFERQFPDIEVEARKMGPAEMDSALEAERSTGAEGADVVTSVSYAVVHTRQQEGWYVDLEGPSVASGWAGTKYITDNQILSAPLGLVVIGWNTQLLPDGISSYQDLYDPDLQGGAIGAVRPDLPVFADFWAYVEDNHDENFVEEMAAQEPTLFPDAVSTQEALVAGEIAVGLFATAADMENFKADGAPVDYVLPDPAWTAQNLFFIPESTTHANAAQVFVDFFASPTGQLAAARYGFSPVEEVADETVGGGSEIVLTDVERMLDPSWYEGWVADWKAAFGE